MLTLQLWPRLRSFITTYASMASPTTSKLTTAIDPQAVSHLCQLPPELLLHILDLIFQEHFPFAAATGLDDIVELTDEESDSEDGDFEDDGNSYGSDHSHQSVDSEELEIDDYSDPNYHSILTPDARPSSEDLEILALLDPEEVSRSTYMIPAILRSCRLLRLRGKETFLQYLTEDALHVQRTKSCMLAERRQFQTRPVGYQMPFRFYSSDELFGLREIGSGRMLDAIRNGEILA